MRLSLRHFLLITLFSVGFIPHSVTASVGTEGASFLDIPVGADAAALGGAYSARASDVYGVVWNPAALAHVSDWQLAGQHLDYLESIHYEFAGVAIPLRPGSTLGAGVQYLGSGDIQQRANDGTTTGNFSNHYAAYSVAFGQALSDTLSLGLTGKWIESQLSDIHANTFAADAAAFYSPTERLSLAATLTNAGAPLTFINQSDPLPMAGRLGLLYSVLRGLNVSLDGVYRLTGLASAHTGIEWQPIPGISIRAGYRTDTLRDLSPLAGVTAGLGITLFGQELAYAWLPMGDLGNTQYLSMLLKFGTKDQDHKNLVYLNPLHNHHDSWSPPATVHESGAEVSSWRGKKRESDSDIDQHQLMELLSDRAPDMAAAQ